MNALDQYDMDREPSLHIDTRLHKHMASDLLNLIGHRPVSVTARLQGDHLWYNG